MKHKKLKVESGKLKVFPFLPEVRSMEILLRLDPSVVLFYSRIASSTGLPLDRVLSDALFKLAGELSLQALQHI